jgi:predicted O-methyltransferase YrrM
VPPFLRFLRTCIGGPGPAVVRPDAAVASEIARWTAATGPLPVVVADVAAVPRDARCVYLGPGVRWASPTPRSAVLGTDLDAVPAATDRVVVPLRLRPADRRPAAYLALDGAAPTPAADAALAAIAEAGRTLMAAEPVAPDLGALLFVLAVARRSRALLEIGTGTGAAAVWLASAADGLGGRLTSIERDSALLTRARRHLKQSGVSAAARLELGDAARLIGRLTGAFDLVLFDETPADRSAHLQALLSRLAPGALVVSRGGIGNAGALAPFHAHLRTLPRFVAAASLAVGDGVTMAVLR